MSDFKVVGRSIPRLDGPEKVRGGARFLADRVLLEMADAWRGATLRSPVPYGRLLGVRRDPAFDWSRVVVLTADGLPAGNFVHITRDEFPILAEEAVHYTGQPVALIAAPDESTLQAALAALAVDVEPLNPVLTIDESLAGSTVIWGTDNVVDAYRVRCGDMERGFAEADAIVEGTYETGLQEQMYLETQAMAAIPMPDGTMEVTGSIQCPYYVLGAVATALGVEPSRVRIRQTEVGGGFGGKEDYPSILGVHAALLAQKCGCPVAMIYDRKEDLLVSPKRHPSRVRHRTGVKRDGTITAMEIDIVLDAGAYTTLTMVILQRSVLHATGTYYVPNAYVSGRAVATNTPPTGAFRGFGAPQSIFAVERQMDRIAEVLGMDPLDLRLKNIIKNGMPFPYKQVLQSGASAQEVLERAAELSGYRAKRARYAAEAKAAIARGEKTVRGIGISVALHGGGFTGAAEDTMGTTVRVVYRDGIFYLYTSAVDMGQGSSTVLPQIAAETLGVDVAKVRHPLPDTYECPNSGPTVASRSTMFIGRVLHGACEEIVEELRAFLASREGIAAASVVHENGVFLVGGRRVDIMAAAEAYVKECGALDVTRKHEHRGKSAWDPEKFEGDAYKGFGWIAQAVEVEVDMDTYEANPTHAFVVAEVGRAINPTLASGQLEGGVLQGCGWSHIESLEVDAEGRYTAEHMSEYLVPTMLDAPKWEVEMLEVPSEVGPYGAKGIGELPANGGAPAFLAAVQNATGVFADFIPLTGERLWRKLEEQGEMAGAKGGDRS